MHRHVHGSASASIVGSMLGALLGVLPATGVAAEPGPAILTPDSQKRVLVVHSSRRDAPYTVLVENALRKTIGDALGGRFDYYVEYVDAEMPMTAAPMNANPAGPPRSS